MHEHTHLSGKIILEVLFSVLVLACMRVRLKIIVIFHDVCSPLLSLRKHEFRNYEPQPRKKRRLPATLIDSLPPFHSVIIISSQPPASSFVTVLWFSSRESIVFHPSEKFSGRWHIIWFITACHMSINWGMVLKRLHRNWRVQIELLKPNECNLVVNHSNKY